ncbi:hypothetical protein ACWCQS_06835 [Streptomyces sp. NPDC002076]
MYALRLAAMLTPLGAILATDAFPATSAGYHELPDREQSFGTLVRAGGEGTGSYGRQNVRNNGPRLLEGVAQ